MILYIHCLQREGKGIKTEISSMPGVFQMSIDEILKECEYLQKK